MVAMPFNLDDTDYRNGEDETPREFNPTAQSGSSSNLRKPSNHDELPSSHASMSQLENARFLFWVDAVGGFLVCTKNEVLLGQAVPECHVDIPILADVARNHLKLTRGNDGYLLEPFGYVKVNQQEIAGPCILNDGDLIHLTGGVEMTFSSSHPLSASARLDIQSPHRTEPWSDAILLMAESCVFGPDSRNHVVCPTWEEDIVFFKRNQELYCKSFRPIIVDGTIQSGKVKVGLNSHLEGEDFSMTLEPISKT